MAQALCDNQLIRLQKGRIQMFNEILNHFTGFDQVQVKLREHAVLFIRSVKHIKSLQRIHGRFADMCRSHTTDHAVIIDWTIRMINAEVANMTDCYFTKERAKEGCKVMKAECRALLLKCMNEVSSHPNPEQLQRLLTEVKALQPEVTKNWLQAAMAQRRSYVKRLSIRKQKLLNQIK